MQNLILKPERKLLQRLLLGASMKAIHRRSITELVDDLAFTQNIFVEKETVIKTLKKVQSFDPGGAFPTGVFIASIERKLNQN